MDTGIYVSLVPNQTPSGPLPPVTAPVSSFWWQEQSSVVSPTVVLRLLESATRCVCPASCGTLSEVRLRLVLVAAFFFFWLGFIINSHSHFTDEAMAGRFGCKPRGCGAEAKIASLLSSASQC